MTKMKKLNKIIPAVLLSGAMLMPVSQLTSPIIANALENKHSQVDLSSLKFKTESTKENLLDQNYTFNNRIAIVSGSSITFNLNKEYNTLDVDLGTHRNDVCPLTFEFFVDGVSKEKVTVQRGVGEVGSTVDSPHVKINLDNADKLKIIVSNADNSPYAFFGQLNNAILTKNNKLTK